MAFAEELIQSAKEALEIAEGCTEPAAVFPGMNRQSKELGGLLGKPSRVIKLQKDQTR